MNPENKKPVFSEKTGFWRIERRKTMKRYYAVISLWISVALFPNVAVAGNIVNNLSDNAVSQNQRIINPRLEHISERLSGKLEYHFQSSYRGVLPSEYNIWNHKPFLGMDAKFQAKYDMNNYYAAVSEAKVYDDKGKPITEEEIRAYMVRNYRPGCCLLGCVIGSGASFLLGCAAGFYVVEVLDSYGDDDTVAMTFYAVWGVGTVASGLAGYKAGEEIDRRKAIELIREERRAGRKLPKTRRKFLQGVVIGLGAVGAAVLVIGIAGD